MKYKCSISSLSLVGLCLKLLCLWLWRPCQLLSFSLLVVLSQITALAEAAAVVRSIVVSAACGHLRLTLTLVAAVAHVLGIHFLVSVRADHLRLLFHCWLFLWFDVSAERAAFFRLELYHLLNGVGSQLSLLVLVVFLDLPG